MSENTDIFSHENAIRTNIPKLYNTLGNLSDGVKLQKAYLYSI